MNSIIPSRRFLLLLFVCMALMGLPSSQAAANEGADPFPVYPCIRPNVNFWKKVFTEYSSTSGFIHDTERLDIIYEVIELVDDELPEARQLNRLRAEEGKNKYRAILQHLGAGNEPQNAEEIRVAQLFGPGAGNRVFREAADTVRFQACMRERFLDGVFRSVLYIDEMKRILRGYGIPEDLAYLPHVESSFNYSAYSKVGAAGIWQFTRGTGARYLRIDNTLDERRDPIKATHAAGRYLRENLNLLGNWPLTITSYNHGETGMLRAKNLHGGYEEVYTKYESPSFKFASKNFYPEFLAAREVAKNYKTYFGNLVLNPPLKVDEVELTEFVPMASLAATLRMDMATIKELNPALADDIYAGHRYAPKGYRLRVPATEAKKVDIYLAGLKQEAIAKSVAASAPVTRKKAGAVAQKVAGQVKTRPNPEKAGAKVAAAPVAKAVKAKPTSAIHVVNKGETLLALAAHYETPLSELREANSLNTKSVIRPGQKIVIPSGNVAEVSSTKTSATPPPDKENKSKKRRN